MMLFHVGYLVLFVTMGALGIRKGRRLHQQWGSSKRSTYPWPGRLSRHLVTGRQMVFVGTLMILIGLIGFSFLIDAPGWVRARLSPCHDAVDVEVLSETLGLPIADVSVFAEDGQCVATYFVEDGRLQSVLRLSNHLLPGMPVSERLSLAATESSDWYYELLICEETDGASMAFHRDFFTRDDVFEVLATQEGLCFILSGTRE